jgi:hypothetical protein
MAAIQTRLNKVGNFLKKELWPAEGYCRTNGTVDFDTTALGNEEVGEIVYRAVAGTGNWGAVPATLAGGSEVGVIVDDQIEEFIATARTAGATTVEKIAIFSNGPAQIRTGGLSDAGAGGFDEAIVALEAVGIQFIGLKAVRIQDFGAIA